MLHSPISHAILLENLLLNCKKFMEQDWTLHVQLACPTRSCLAIEMAKQATIQGDQRYVYNRPPSSVAHLLGPNVNMCNMG